MNEFTVVLCMYCQGTEIATTTFSRETAHVDHNACTMVHVHELICIFRNWSTTGTSSTISTTVHVVEISVGDLLKHR